MSQTRATANAVLKDFYLPAVRNVLNSEVFLLSQFEVNSEDVEGKAAVLSINTGRNHGVGARLEGGTLPAAGRQGYVEQRVPLFYNYGSIRISGPLMRSMNTDRGSFTRPLQSETAGVIRDLKNDVNRQTFGNGTGAIAPISGANTAATFPVANATTTQMRQLEEGMVISIGTLANPVLRTASAQILSVQVAAKTVTLTTTVTTSATDFIFRAGSGGVVGTDQKEVTGLAAIVSPTGTLFGINPATVSRWASYSDANSGTPRAVTENMFTRASMEVSIRSGEQINLWVTTDGVQRGVANLMQSLRRFPVPTQLKSGYSGIDMSANLQGQTGTSEVTLTYDKDCTGNTAYGLTTGRIQQYRMSDWEFMEEDGAVLSRVSGVDAYEATLFCYHEMAVDSRNAHAVISDLVES
jgi:hypothetical protein